MVAAPKSPDFGPDGKTRKIAKERLRVDRTYQRIQSSKLIQTIADHWFTPLCGVLSVATRTDGSLWVYDGAARLQAAIMRDDITHLKCEVYPTFSVQEEARLFVWLNRFRNPVLGADLLEGDIVSGDDVARKTKEIIEAHGFVALRYGDSLPPNRKTFTAITCLRRLVAQGDGAATMDFIMTAWPDLSYIRSFALKGVHAFVRLIAAQPTARIEPADAIEFFSSIPFADVRARADTFAATGKKRGILWKGVCTALVALWNDGHRTRKLKLAV